MSREFAWCKDGFYELDENEMNRDGSHAGCGCLLFILFWIVAGTVIYNWGTWFPREQCSITL